jgi:hypothetical protein
LFPPLGVSANVLASNPNGTFPFFKISPFAKFLLQSLPEARIGKCCLKSVNQGTSQLQVQFQTALQQWGAAFNLVLTRLKKNDDGKHTGE